MICQNLNGFRSVTHGALRMEPTYIDADHTNSVSVKQEISASGRRASGQKQPLLSRWPIYARCVRSVHRILCIFLGSESIFPEYRKTLICNINSRLVDNWLTNPQRIVYFSSLMNLWDHYIESLEQSKLSQSLPQSLDMAAAGNTGEISRDIVRSSSPGARKSTVTVLEQGWARLSQLADGYRGQGLPGLLLLTEVGLNATFNPWLLAEAWLEAKRLEAHWQNMTQIHMCKYYWHEHENYSYGIAQEREASSTEGPLDTFGVLWSGNPGQQPEGTEFTLPTAMLLTNVWPRSVGRILGRSAVVGNENDKMEMKKQNQLDQITTWSTSTAPCEPGGLLSHQAQEGSPSVPTIGLDLRSHRTI